MKKLNNEEIKIMADALGMSIQEAQETADLFVKIYEEQGNKSGWKIGTSLNTVDDYINEWEDHWHRESNWQEYYEYEKENCYADYDFEIGRAEKVFKNIESFKEEVDYCSYELSNGLIIVVC
jgi:hypothetical protein